MKREIIRTEDGSNTLYVPELNEHYHSIHGAIQESMHVFIRTGLEYCTQPQLAILEAGFGTGLNAILTLEHALQQGKHILYHTYEKYPLSPEEAEAIEYTAHLSPENAHFFHQLHTCEWEKDIRITPCFTIHKHLADFENVDTTEMFDIVFFDAFNPDVQPRLWSVETLGKFCKALKPGGIFTTYCVKGTVKRALRTLGFTIERLPGPPGKREIMRARKPLISNE